MDHIVFTSIIGARLLLESGLAYIDTLMLELVGTHSRNREGQMLVIANVQRLFKMMASNGYNPDLVKNLAVECSPQKIQVQRDANIRIWERADGLLARSNANKLKYFTLMGSHTTAVFRIMKYGGIILDERFADASGQLQQGKLLDAVPSLKEPIDQGLKYYPDTKIYPILYSVEMLAYVEASTHINHMYGWSNV